MKIDLKTAVVMFAFLTLTSCLEAPKAREEATQGAAEYEKVIDDIVGPATIVPEGIKVNDQDVMVESLKIANSVTRERFRRELTVLEATKEGNQTQYKFQVKVIQRDDQGNPQLPVTTIRTLILILTDEGYYQFVGDGTEYTVFSWDFLVGLRGFCSSFETENESVTFACSSIQVEAANYGPLNIPVRKLSLNRTYTVRNKVTGAVDTGKLRYVIQIAPQVQEISKVVSFCVEGLQKIDNAVYQLVNCNNVESLSKL